MIAEDTTRAKETLIVTKDRSPNGKKGKAEEVSRLNTGTIKDRRWKRTNGITARNTTTGKGTGKNRREIVTRNRRSKAKSTEARGPSATPLVNVKREKSPKRNRNVRSQRDIIKNLNSIKDLPPQTQIRMHRRDASLRKV